MKPAFQRPWDSLGCEDPFADVPDTTQPSTEQPAEDVDKDVDDSSCWPESIREAA
jgi:hypothetical protein